MYDQCQCRFPFRFVSLTCLLLATALLCSTTSVRAAEMLTLDDAVKVALSANPGLVALDARAQALAEVPSQVEALPDPSLSVNLLNLPLDSFSFNQEGMTQLQVAFTQALPYPGKLALRAQAASHEASAAGEEVAARRLLLVRDVKTVWWNIFYLDRALEVVVRNQTLLKQFVNVAETRYQVGRGLQQDILLAQLEHSTLRDNAIRIHNSRENEAARLNVLLDYPPGQRVVLPMSVDERLPALMSVMVLQQRAAFLHPDLSAQRERLEAARSRINLAKKDYAPDFKLGAAYGLRSGSNPDGSGRTDFGSVMFSMTLPLYTASKQDRAVDQRNAEWLQQKYWLHDQRNRVALEVHQAMTDYRRAGEQAILFKEEIIPQARQTVDAMLAGYQVGKVDFLNLIRSQTILYDYETQYWNTISAANQALARSVAAVGEEKIYE